MKFSTILYSGLLATLALAAPCPSKPKKYDEKPATTGTPTGNSKPLGTGTYGDSNQPDGYYNPAKTGTPAGKKKPVGTGTSDGGSDNPDGEYKPAKTGTPAGKKKPVGTGTSDGGSDKPDGEYKPEKTGTPVEKGKPLSTGKSGDDDKPDTYKKKPTTTGTPVGKNKPVGTGTYGGGNKGGGYTSFPSNDTENGTPANSGAGDINDTPEGWASTEGGTTGGAGGEEVTVSTFEELTAAVAGNEKKIVYVSGPIENAAKQVKIGSNTSLIGKSSAVIFTGFGLLVKGETNVIIRNIAIKKVLAENGDAIGIQKSTNVWVDHVDLSSDREHDKDYYDGLLDITHAGDFVTVSYSKLHDHWKAVLVGHSDKNGDEDSGHLKVTLANNHFKNLNSRGPSIRFGMAHLYNNYFEGVEDGINTRDGAQVLVENNMFATCSNPLYSTDGGFAVESGNHYGTGKNSAPQGTLNNVPYKYDLVDASEVEARVVGKAGNTLTF